MELIKRQLPRSDASGDLGVGLLGCMLEEAHRALAAMLLCNVDRDTYLIGLEWVPDLSSAIRGSRPSRLEHPRILQDYASHVRLTAETLRDWLAMRGHPDFGRYLTAYWEFVDGKPPEPAVPGPFYAQPWRDS